MNKIVLALGDNVKDPQPLELVDLRNAQAEIQQMIISIENASGAA